MELLPEEINQEILFNLPLAEIAASCRTSWQWQDRCKDDFFWDNLATTRYPNFQPLLTEGKTAGSFLRTAAFFLLHLNTILDEVSYLEMVIDDVEVSQLPPLVAEQLAKLWIEEGAEKGTVSITLAQLRNGQYLISGTLYYADTEEYAEVLSEEELLLLIIGLLIVTPDVLSMSGRFGDNYSRLFQDFYPYLPTEG